MSQYNELPLNALEVEKSGSSRRSEQSEARSCKMVNRKTLIVIGVAVVAAVLAFVVGYLVRRAVHAPECSSNVPGGAARSMAQREKDWNTIVKKLDPKKIDANMK